MDSSLLKPFKVRLNTGNFKMHEISNYNFICKGNALIYKRQTEFVRSVHYITVIIYSLYYPININYTKQIHIISQYMSKIYYKKEEMTVLH